MALSAPAALAFSPLNLALSPRLRVERETRSLSRARAVEGDSLELPSNPLTRENPLSAFAGRGLG